MGWIALEELLAAPSGNRPVAHEPMFGHGDFARLSLAAASALQARGARHVGLWFEDAVQLAVALFACWRAGAIAVLPGDARAATCAALDPGLDFWIAEATPLPLPTGRQIELSALVAPCPATPPLVPQTLDLDAAGIVLCTSGSSGQPKQIAKRWRQLAAEIQALEQQWCWAGEPVCVLGSVSPQHMYGLPFRVLWPLCAGRPIGRRQLVYPEDLQRASLAHQACAWIGSPALLKRLGQRMDWAMLAPRLRQIFSSGGPLPPEASDAIADRLHCRPVEIYGSSETGAVAWRQGSGAWRPLPSVQGGLNDAGALWVHSPWLHRHAPEQTVDAATLEAGGFQAGGFRLLGRLDRIVKIEEKRIALPALEGVLALHPFVREARLGQAALAQRLTALVALGEAGIHALRNRGRKALVDELRLHMASHVEPLGIPRSWRFMRELPWNEQGKLPQHSFEAAAIRPLLPHVRTAAAPLDPLPAMPAKKTPEGTDSTTNPAGAAPERLADECRFCLDIPLDLAHFSGHFPATPVVPGVVQIDWALSLARRHLVPGLEFHGMETLKFQRLLRPGDTVDLILRLDRARARLYFDYRAAGQPCSSGRILAQAPGRPTP